VILFWIVNSMFSEIQTLLTNHSSACITQANTLAFTKKQKTIHGEDLFWWISMFLKHNDFNTIFWKLLGISEEILEEYFQNTYNISTIGGVKEEIKTLPLNKKINQAIQTHINESTKKLDLDILFLASFDDLSNECINHLSTHNIHIETLVENYKKLTKNPIIMQMWLFAFLQILSKILVTFNLDINKIKLMEIEKMEKLHNVNMLLDAVESEIVEKENTSATGDKSKKEEKKLTIEYFGTDLTKEVKDGLIDPIFGRENEINQIIYTLLRKNKNNPLLIWEAGVGKTAIVEWLAQKIARNDVPEKLKNKRIFLLDMGTLLAGTKYRGEFESRMKSILEEAIDPTNNIILFIDEIHTIIGAGGQENGDAAQMLKPLLSRGKIKLIGSTTFNEYQKYIEKDQALKRRFQEVVVNEPDIEATKQILMGLKQTYEDFHGVQITDESLDVAINLSKRYMMNKFLPDKALDIIDEACARKSTMNQKLDNDKDYKKYEETLTKIQKKIEEAIEKQDYFGAAELKAKEEEAKVEMTKIRTNKNIPINLRPIIDKDDIGNVLADKTGIPTNIVNESEIERLRRLDEVLKSNIVGQDEAVEAVVKTLTRSRLSVIKYTKPIGSFLCLGPSGVGKTYLAKLIAKEYFGNPDAMIRIDMSEFMEKYSVSKLIGSPAGYVGYEEWGGLTEAVRRKPYCVILFDEIEKAATDVLNILLQILDEGHLKDAKGRMVDFKNTIIIMTSNIWSEEFVKKQSTIGFATGEKWDLKEKAFAQVKERVLEEMKNFLTPELLNRIDYKIVFKHLSKDILVKIMKNKITEFLAARKLNSEIALPKYSDKQIKDIIDKIYEPQYGARPLERYIQDEIEPQLIKKIMEVKKIK